MPHPFTSSTRACVVAVLRTTAPGAEAASSRSSSRVPDHAPEAFIRHRGRWIPASVVDSVVMMPLLTWWLRPSADHQDCPSDRVYPINGAHSTVLAPVGSRQKPADPVRDKGVCLSGQARQFRG